MRTRLGPIAWRRVIETVAAALIVLWALVVTIENAAIAVRQADGEPDWYDAQVARYATLRDGLSIEHPYRYVLLTPATAGDDAARAQGFAEYLLAPAHVDASSDSPWLVVDAGDEASLAAWLERHDVEVIKRPGNGLLVARERGR